MVYNDIPFALESVRPRPTKRTKIKLIAHKFSLTSTIAYIRLQYAARNIPIQLNISVALSSPILSRSLLPVTDR